MSTLAVTNIISADANTPLILKSANTTGGQIILHATNNDVQFVGSLRFTANVIGDGSGFTFPSSNVANAAFDKTNIAFSTVNAAFLTANNALANTSGTFDGALTVNTTLTVNTSMTVGGDNPFSYKINANGMSGAGTTWVGATNFAADGTAFGAGHICTIHGTNYSYLYQSGVGNTYLTNANTATSQGSLNFGTSGSVRVTIDRPGNVGFGTTAPSYPVDIWNNSTDPNYYATRLYSSANASGTSITHLRLEKGTGYGGTIGGFINQGVTAGLVLSTLNAGTLSNQMYLTTAGTVSIGTANTSTGKLIVNVGSGQYTPGLYIEPTQHATSKRSGIQLDNWTIAQDTGGSGTKDFGIYDAAATAWRMRIEATGNTTFSGNVTINGINSGYAPNRPAFRVSGSGTTNNLTTTQNGTGCLTANNWTVDFNTGTYLANTNGVFTAPVTGLYQVNIVGRNSGYTAGISQLGVTKNGSSGGTVGGTCIMMVEFAANSSMNHAGASTVIKLNAGDTLACKILAGQINFDGNDNWSVSYIG